MVWVTTLISVYAAVVVHALNSSVKTVDLGYAQYQSDVSLAEGVTSFLGVRYAAPPVGKLYCAALYYGAKDSRSR